jgi:hypothetical protein
MPAPVPFRRPARILCSCRGRTAPRRADPDQTVLDQAPSRVPAGARRPAMSQCRGCRGPVRVPSPVPALAPRPARIPCSAGWRRIQDPPPASCRSSARRERTVPGARPSPAPASAQRPATPQRSGPGAGPGQAPSRVPAGARRPATTRCSVGSGRTARPPADRRAAQRRTDPGWRTVRQHRCGRRRTAVDRLPDRSALPWAPCPGRTVPGQPAPVLAPARKGQARTARVLVARPRTGLARIRLVSDLGPLAQDLLARMPAVRPATVAPGRRYPALAVALVRPLASQARTGPPTTAQPGTGRGRHPGLDRAARVLPRWPPTPGRTGARMPARSAPLPVASRVPPPHALDPVGPAPARASPVPDTPAPADGQEPPALDSPALDTQGPAARRPDRTARPDENLDADPDLVRTYMAPAARRTLRAVARAGAPGAADPDQAQGQPAGGGDLPGVAGDGQRPASRLRDAAKVCRPNRDRTPPACPTAAGIRA